jgi:ribonuclease E
MATFADDEPVEGAEEAAERPESPALTVEEGDRNGDPRKRRRGRRGGRRGRRGRERGVERVSENGVAFGFNDFDGEIDTTPQPDRPTREQPFEEREPRIAITGDETDFPPDRGASEPARDVADERSSREEEAPRSERTERDPPRPQAPPEEEDEGRPKRTGWWTRRSFF